MKFLAFKYSSVKNLSSVLSGRMQKNVIGEKSDCIDLHQGVPSVTVPWPLLFYLYVINFELIMSEIIQYADDTVFLTYHRDLDIGKKFQYPIDTLLDYCTPLVQFHGVT